MDHFAIEANGISFSYASGSADRAILRGLSLKIARGENVCVLGHSGCGKSTLLSVLLGLSAPDEGEVLFEGKRMNSPDPRMAVVFQDCSLFPWMTARGNVAFGIRQARGVSRSEAMNAADKYLRQVGLSASADRYPFQQSGGMRQRTAIARLLAVGAQMLFFDEPFSALDPEMRGRLQRMVSGITKADKKRSMLFVTHNVEEAMLLGDRILFMAEGHICKEVVVPFKFPRDRQTIIKDPKYFDIANYLAKLFYEYRQEIQRRCQ